MVNNKLNFNTVERALNTEFVKITNEKHQWKNQCAFIERGA